jgi:hypothetical protein
MPWIGKNPIEWAAKMKDAPREAINIFAFEIFKRVVLNTPVDTGQARSNWLVSINGEDDSVIGADVKIRKIKKRKGEDAGKTVTKRSVKLERSANDTIRVGLLATNSAQGDDKIFIQNNLPYIAALEFGRSDIKNHVKTTPDGHSLQSPNGMVGLVLAKADQLWDRAVKAVKGEGGNNE